MSDIFCVMGAFSVKTDRIAQWVPLFLMNFNDFSIIYVSLCINDKTIAQWVHHIYAMRTNGDAHCHST